MATLGYSRDGLGGLGHAGSTHGLFGRMQKFGNGLFANWQARREVRRLLRMDDRLLADLGITRADVDLALSQPMGENCGQTLARLREDRRRDRSSGIQC